MYYVYVLQSKLNDQSYVGSTNNLKSRFEQHNDGKTISTKRYKPWKLLYYEAYESEKLARMREKRLKYNGNAMRELKKRIGFTQRQFGAGFTKINSIVKFLKSGAGFTLIELLVVISIIGVLVSSLFFVLNPVDKFAKSRDAQRKSDLEQMRNALDIYYNDNNRYPSQIDFKIEGILWSSPWPPYMTKLPKDPVSSQDYRYEAPKDGSSYRLYAKLEKCSDPQIIPGIDCATSSYNYSVTSTNTSIIAFATPTPTPTITPTPTPTPPPIFAIGGEITGSGGYTIHAFRSPGTWTFTPSRSMNVEYLVVAGGGSGGTDSGGGGGAGGFRTGTGFAVTAGQAYTVRVGAGGPVSPDHSNGNDSVFDSITSIGGGHGSGQPYTPGNGGSGGGASGGGGTKIGGTGTAGQGNNGGGSFQFNNFPGGGGGGAGAVGGTPATSNSAAGNGGVGLESLISGSSVYYAGGGGGAGILNGSGGNGGGGNANAAGKDNTGGGGGAGGAGGSGIVIIRYR